MSRAINVNMKANVKDFPKYEAEFAAAGKDAAKIQRAVEKYTGPDNGTEYDDETGKLSIVPGWHADADGNVVRD